MGGMLSSTFNKSTNTRNNSGPGNTVINVKPNNNKNNNKNKSGPANTVINVKPANTVAINVKPNNKNKSANIPVGESIGIIPPTNENVSNSLKQTNNNVGSNTSSKVGNGNNTDTNQEGGRRKRKTRKASRKSMKGGGLKEEALAYLKSQKKTPKDLFWELHKRNPNGSYESGTVSMGGFTFKSNGHPAQMVWLDVKKNSNNNSKYTSIFTDSDH